jgi:hypothetical protein
VIIAQQQETASQPQLRSGIDSVVQHPVCKHCPANDAIIKAQDARIMELEEALAVRTHTSIKSAEELIHRSTDGYQHLEFSVPFEPLRQHMVYPVNKTLPDRVWFTVQLNSETGRVVDVRIGRTTDTDTAEVEKDGVR